MDDLPVNARSLLRWSEALSGIARTGLGFTESLYERERFEEILKVVLTDTSDIVHEEKVVFLSQRCIEGSPNAGVVDKSRRRDVVVDGELGCVAR